MTRRQIGGQRGIPLGAAEYALANSVLMRDRAKTQYLVLPLAAGALARCVLAAPPDSRAEDWLREMWPELETGARELLARCDPTEDDQWTTDADRYGVVADFALFAWPAFLRWTPITWLLHTLGLLANAPPAARVNAVERWLRNAHDRSLLHCMLVASHGFTVASRPSEPPLHARGAQRLRVMLAERLRSAGLTSWPHIVRAANDDWNVGTLQRFAMELADACDLALIDPFALVQDIELDDEDFDDEFDDEHDISIDGAPDHNAGPALESETTTPSSVADAAVEAAMTRVRSLESEKERLIEKVVRLQKERDHHVDRHAGAESRAVAIRTELVDARGEIDALRFKLLMATRAREELEDQIAVAASMAPGAPAPPADCFAGRRILLFTGAQAADTREAMRRSFFEFGAQQVDCYYVDNNRGPDTYPPGSLVVVDVTFMPHSVSDSIIDRARSAGVRCFPCRRGASLIAREVAARFQLPARGG